MHHRGWGSKLRIYDQGATTIASWLDIWKVKRNLSYLSARASYFIGWDFATVLNWERNWDENRRYWSWSKPKNRAIWLDWVGIILSQETSSKTHACHEASSIMHCDSITSICFSNLQDLQRKSPFLEPFFNSYNLDSSNYDNLLENEKRRQSWISAVGSIHSRH